MTSSTEKEGPRILVLVGPTCSGKSAISIALAIKLRGEIISADSRQVYKHLDIGTAKPTRADRQKVRHYFVDELLPDQDFNAGEFGERARGVVRRILDRDKVPIVVGGSGLYVRALIDGFFEGPGADDEFRQSMEKRVTAGLIGDLLRELQSVDPETAAAVDPANPHRIIRALEVYHLTGRPMSELHREREVKIDFAPVMFGLRWRRQELYKRIELRCEQMISAGLLHEVERLEAMGYDSSLNAFNTVGYTEAFAYRRGKISYEEFVRLFKQNSRRYAKRQMTWFRRDNRIHWMEMNDEKNTSGVVQEICERFLE